MKSIEDFTGFSELGIDEALVNALENAGKPADFEVVETLGLHHKSGNKYYKVIIKSTV